MNYSELASKEVIEKTLEALKSRNVIPYFVENKSQALEKLQSLISAGQSVMTGGSTTLEQIGFIELLKSKKHPWNNLKDEIFAEPDKARQSMLRKRATLADNFIGSVHALIEDGRAIVASQSGNQIPAYAFTSKNVIWVVGAQKIVSDLEEGFRRVREYVLPLEDQRVKALGMGGTAISFLLIFEKLNSPSRKIQLILVNEVLGF